MKSNRQDDLYKKIADSVSEEPVPDNLKPEAVERLLQSQNRTDTEDIKYKKKSWNWKKPFYGLAGTAAVLALALVLVVNGWVPLPGRNTEHGSIEAVKKAKDEKVSKGEKPIKAEGISAAKDYDQIWELLHAGNSSRIYECEDAAGNGAEYMMTKGESVVEESARDENYGSEQKAATDADSADFSTTNVREEGVGEADRMLTDGTYIYTLGHQKVESGNSKCGTENQKEAVYIFQPDASGKLQQLSVLDLQKDGLSIVEMYLQENELVVLAGKSWTEKRAYGEEDCYGYGYGYEGETFICTYDITDRAAPKVIGRLRVEGFYDTSRLVDGCLYVFTSYSDLYLDMEDQKKDDAKAFVPCVEGEELEPQEVYIPDIKQAQGYLVGVSVKVSEPDTISDRFAVMMNSEIYYISQNNIYIAETDPDSASKTKISKFSYKDGKMDPVAAGSVDGWLNDNFSMDEHEGYLRLVTTKDNADELDEKGWGAIIEDKKYEYITANQLYVLDGQMQVAGKIEDLAKGEKIYSARFMGNVGYFVTYRQVDPLFSVDLSDPSNPVILGELKVSGFSEYLHPYGENRLLGIGWETTYHVDSDRTVRDGMKLAMFDTADLANVQQRHKLVDESVVATSSQYNYKAVLVNVKKNLFGFATTTDGEGSFYCTYRYDESQGFVQVTKTKLMSGAWIDEVRAVYIGDILFILDYNQIYSVSLQDGSILYTQPL